MATIPTFTIDDVKSANFMQGLGNLAAKSNWRTGATWGAGLGAANGLLSDPGRNPDGSPRSRIGAAARGAVGGAVIGGTAGHMLNKHVPGAGVTPPTGLPTLPTEALSPIGAVKVQSAPEFLVPTEKLAKMVDDLNHGIAPEGAKPYIAEIIKRASAAGIEVTAELVAFNLVKAAVSKLAAATADDLNHDLPGNLKAKSTAEDVKARKVKGALRDTSFTPVQLKAKC